LFTARVPYLNISIFYYFYRLVVECRETIRDGRGSEGGSEADSDSRPNTGRESVDKDRERERRKDKGVEREGGREGGREREHVVRHVASLTLVDLAGSENVKHAAITGSSSAPQRLLEGKNINQSLHALNNVFLSLADPKTVYVNFRGSRLTQCLQQSLNGSANVAIICCITPSRL
jgi:Kinesin motor domain